MTFLFNVTEGWSGNFETCIRGTTPFMCKHDLLTADQKKQVDAAERNANYNVCIRGTTPFMCKRNLLTADQKKQVDVAELNANYNVCIRGTTPFMCKHNLLTTDQKKQVDAAELDANYSVCIRGTTPFMCKYYLLTADQKMQVDAAEKGGAQNQVVTQTLPSEPESQISNVQEISELQRNKRIQESLQAIGKYEGQLDGNLGIKSVAAILSWKTSKGYEKTALLSDVQLTELERDAIAILTVKIVTNEEEKKRTAEELSLLRLSAKNDIAVIIGNSDYSKYGNDIPNVTPAYADAEGIRKYFINVLGIQDGNIIQMSDATGSQLTRVFGNRDNFQGQLHNWIKPNVSNVYVYYAGHGAPSGNNGSAFLVPSDASADSIELTGYSLGILYKNLSLLSVKSMTIILESCFSGVSQSGSLISNASPVYLKAKTPEIPSNITVISAGSANQMASWEKDKSNGLFTKYFLMGMTGEADKTPYGNGNGAVDYSELARYLDDTMTYFARRYYGREQNVQISGGNIQ